MMQPNLIIVRAGDSSLHSRWLEGKPQFDILVSYYGNLTDMWRNSGTYYHQYKGLKFDGITSAISEFDDIVRMYTHVAFPDDDLLASTDDWNNVFDICDRRQLDVAQPSLVRNGFASRPFLYQQSGSELRLTNFVEVQTPIMNQRALKVLQDTFPASPTGWGLDFVWPAMLPYPNYRFGIVDAVRVTHTRKSGCGSIYEAAARMNVPYKQHQLDLVRRFGIEMPYHMRVYGYYPRNGGDILIEPGVPEAKE